MPLLPSVHGIGLASLANVHRIVEKSRLDLNYLFNSFYKSIFLLQIRFFLIQYIGLLLGYSNNKKYFYHIIKLLCHYGPLFFR